MLCFRIVNKPLFGPPDKGGSRIDVATHGIAQEVIQGHYGG